MKDVYVFSSSNLTNLWAGIGSEQWAVSPKQAENKSIRTKSGKLPIGSFGIFYCVETRSISSPFVVTSKPSLTATIRGVWDEEWQLPFLIRPLGDPRENILVNDLPSLMPSIGPGKKRWNEVFYVTPTMVFTPSKLDEPDWEMLLLRLLPKSSIEGVAR